jgi:fumarate hydratase class I
MEIARDSGLGAQFGGLALAIGARVVRLSRHAASCPVSVGVSCSAHRNARGKITRQGLFLEELETDPLRVFQGTDAVKRNTRKPLASIDLDAPMDEVRRKLSSIPLGSMVFLSGSLVLARDAAHARFAEALSKGRSLPRYLKEHPVMYAGPAETPEGLPIGSLGPTTAGRMDLYADSFMAEGASLISLAKGNRSPDFASACARYGGFYLGTIGGAAAHLAFKCVLSSKILDFPELGMEAVRLIEVKDLPAFLLVDDKGNDFYQSLAPA